MRRSRFTEEQIISILKEHQTGLSAVELLQRLPVVPNRPE